MGPEGSHSGQSSLRCSALRENDQRLLQTAAVLEVPRAQAVKDLESLGRLQRETLKNPMGCVGKHQRKAGIGLP